MTLDEHPIGTLTVDRFGQVKVETCGTVPSAAADLLARAAGGAEYAAMHLQLDAPDARVGPLVAKVEDLEHRGQRVVNALSALWESNVLRGTEDDCRWCGTSAAAEHAPDCIVRELHAADQALQAVLE